MLACPSSSWIDRRSAPPSSRWVANECRSACGLTRPAIAASETQRPSRLVTSEGDSRRPLFETSSARSSRFGDERRAGALQVEGDGALGRLSQRNDPLLAALAGDPDGLGFEVDRLAVERDELGAAQATGVGELEHRPVPGLERRAGWDPIEQGSHLVAVEDPGQP